MAALTSNVPRLLELLESMPENFPSFFLVHVVDLLYYAGRLSEPRIRERHLMAYAEHLAEVDLQGFALSYLRAGSSSESKELLKSYADGYCAAAVADEAKLWKALTELEELGLQDLGRKHCWSRAHDLKEKEDFLSSICWACWAVVGLGPETGASELSELCDAMAAEDMTRLLTALAPFNLEESFDDCPSPGLLAALAPPEAPPLPTLPASARLYFYIQRLGFRVSGMVVGRYAHCHALHRARRPVALWAPVLVKLWQPQFFRRSSAPRLSHGFAPAPVQLHVLKARAYVCGLKWLQEELAWALDEDPCPFEPEEVLALMRITHVAPRRIYSLRIKPRPPKAGSVVQRS